MNKNTYLIAGIPLDVSYTKSRYRAQTWLEPEEPVEVEIDKIEIGDEDITELLSDKALDDLRVKILTNDTYH